MTGWAGSGAWQAGTNTHPHLRLLLVWVELSTFPRGRYQGILLTMYTCTNRVWQSHIRQRVRSDCPLSARLISPKVEEPAWVASLFKLWLVNLPPWLQMGIVFDNVHDVE